MADEEAARDAADLLNCAYFYLGQAEWPEALAAAQEARDLFDELQAATGSAESRLLLGFIYYSMNEFKTALPVLASAQQQFAAVGAFKKQCATLYLLANCHLGLEKPSKAVYALKLADKIIASDPADAADQDDAAMRLMPDWQVLREHIRALLSQLEDKFPHTP